MNSQKYNRKIRIEQDGEVQDASGAWVTGWSTLAELWADVRHTSGAEAIRGDAITSTARASVRIRYRTGLTAGMRVTVVSTGAIYSVLSVLPDLQRREFVDLVCEVVT